MGVRGLLLSSAVTYVGTILSVLFMMGYYGVALRGAGTEAYGALQSIMSFTFLLYAGRGVVGGYVVIHTGGDDRQLPSIVRQAITLVAYLGLGTMGLFLVLSPFVRDFLRLESVVSLVLLGVAAVPSVLAGGIEGVLNVQKKFAALSLSTIIIPVCNLVGAYVLFRDGFQEADAGLLVLSSHAISLVNSFFWMDRGFLARIPAASRVPLHLFKDFLTLLITSILFGAALRADLFWAKHALNASESGTYAISVSIAMVLYLISSDVARVASVSFRSEPALKIVAASYGIILATCLALGLSFVISGQTVLNILTGHAVVIHWNTLLPLFASFTLYSIITLDFSCLNVLTKRVHVGISIALACTQIIALSAFGTSGTTIALTQCAVMAIFTLIFTLWLAKAVRSSRKAVPAHPAEAHLAPHG